MNVAIIYDAEENAEISTEKLLAWEFSAGFMLKQFYLHSNIDAVVMILGSCNGENRVKGCVKKWKREYSVCKPVKVCGTKEDVKRALEGIGDITGHTVDLYVFHDIRYPFVTEEMIYLTEQKASVYGIAVTVGEAGENVVWKRSGERLPESGYYCAGYPVAVRAGNPVLREIDRPSEVLGKLIENKPYLCRVKGNYPRINTRESLEMAEMFIRTGGWDAVCR